MELTDKTIKLLEKQGFVIVSTINENGGIHSVAKGIVGIEKEGKVFIIDLFKNHTYKNLKRNPIVSITAIDENSYDGFTLQGRAKIVPREDIQDHLVSKWEDKIIERISNRMISSIQKGKKTNDHHEAKLPKHPKYLIEIDVDEVEDLSATFKINS
ncbi:MAG: pyridoxamine 5'-phosphate oxidase family protein [Candidatus Omnitrophica bacterium]|nr:pyridoxamine 5'-phosphate oxidase family protein [Candidatus Omnitrophota bacterium]MBU1996137.1 pyridoxamine 5'-phosphate oxidase family protein [Candidatus Omnitrophota bacterium]MBU4334822.1 pyridoxamine 5'-phosphate oxidase family protein [Candidatus Omnitrophota bacterium]